MNLEGSREIDCLFCVSETIKTKKTIMIIFEQNRNSYFLNRLSDVNNFSKAESFRYRKSDVHTRYKIKRRKFYGKQK